MSLKRPFPARWIDRLDNGVFNTLMFHHRESQQPRQIFFSFAAVRASSATNGSLYPDDAAELFSAGFTIFSGNAAS
ncbi:hypothetical protein [uncultured Bradyrhizobium sp.]|uniref:hypothetical protein n=1 Tax=uncultured Bradyrhizobium sp. TaxID=199684 RepID=UPI002622B1EB|nr:hypothetical protein [uncultured Bradyrhizobium sp.]